MVRGSRPRRASGTLDEAAQLDRLAHALEGDVEGGFAGLGEIAIDAVHEVPECGHQADFELLDDAWEGPAELLDVLRPLEVGDRDTAGVHEDVRQHDDVARLEDRIS